ncbi:MAG TPA: hypothetical protein VIL35_02745 [Vicinamibacterales bacterium]
MTGVLLYLFALLALLVVVLILTSRAIAEEKRLNRRQPEQAEARNRRPGPTDPATS